MQLVFKSLSLLLAGDFVLGIKPSGASNYNKFIVPTGLTSFSFTADIVPAGVDFEWGVLAICDDQPINLAYFATAYS